MLFDVLAHVANIVQFSEIADKTKLLREVMIELRKAREDFSLEKALAAMDPEQLMAATVYYRPTRKALLGYVARPEHYEPEAVVEAVDILLELARQDKMPLNREVGFQIHQALLYVATKNADDWRVRRQVREQVVALGALANRHFIEQTVVHDWRNLLADADLDRRTREDAAIIAVALGAKGEDIKKVLIETIHDQEPERRLWAPYNAAAALITMDDDEGLRYLTPIRIKACRRLALKARRLPLAS